MSILKKIAAPLTAVALVAAMGVSLLSAQRTAEAATTVTVAASTAVSLTTNATNGTAVGTALAGNIVLNGAAIADFIVGTIVFSAPTGFVFNTAPTNAVDVTYGVNGGALAGNAVVTYATDGSTMTVTVTAASTTVTNTITIGATNKPFIMSTTNTTGQTGNITYNAGSSTGDPVGLADGASVAPLTVTGQIVGPYTLTLTAPVTSVAADGSQSTTVTGALRDANSARVTNTPVVWTVSLGIVSTGTAKSAVSVTGAGATGGNATQTYRGGGGVAATDTIIGSVSSINVVGTLSMTLASPSGTTASKIAITSPAQLAIAPTVTNVSPGYVSPQIGTNFSIHVTDSAGLGVNTQTILISVDKGALVAGFNGACAGVSTRAITGATVGTGPLTLGGVNTAGVIAATYCGNQVDAAGKATITAQNISTSMANATQTVTMAGRPNKITATATGTAIAAVVTDASGNNVADGTPVRFTISANAGAVSTACTTTSNGAASSVVALIGATSTVIVSSDFNETGSPASCAAAAPAAAVFNNNLAGAGSGTKQVATSIEVGAGGGTVTPPVTPPVTGAGGFASAPVYSASKLAQAVFNGGTVAQLETAVTAGNGTGVWAQDSKGVFVLYIVNGGFVNDAFKAAFPTGFSGVTAVTVVGK